MNENARQDMSLNGCFVSNRRFIPRPRFSIRPSRIQNDDLGGLFVKTSMPLLLNRFHQRQQSLHDFQRGGGIAGNLDIHRNYLVGAAENGIAVFKYSPVAGVIADGYHEAGLRNADI